MVQGECQKRQGVGVEPVAARKQVVERGPLRGADDPPLRNLVVGRKRVEHPRLHIQTALLLHDLELEEPRRPIHRIAPDVPFGDASQAHPPQDVGRHEVIALAALEPPPSTVGVLEVVEPLETTLDDLVELAEVCTLRPSPGMGLVDKPLLDTAEDPPQRNLDGKLHPLQRPRGHNRRQEPAHRLLCAPIGVVDQVGKRIEHRHRHAPGHVDDKLGGARLPAGRDLELDRHRLAPHLTGAKDELLNAVLVDGVGLLHGIRVAPAPGGEPDLRLTRGLNDGDPVDAPLTAGGDANSARRPGDRPAPLENPGDLEPRDLEQGLNGHRLVGVVVQDTREGDGVADDKEPRSLEPRDERPAGPRRGGSDPEPAAGGGGACGGLPLRERVAVLDPDRRSPIGSGDEIRLPQDRRAEIAADDDGGLPAGAAGPARLPRRRRGARRLRHRAGRHVVTRLQRHHLLHRRAGDTSSPPCAGLQMVHPQLVPVAFVSDAACEPCVDQQFGVGLDEPDISLAAEGARRVNDEPLAVVEEELPRVGGVLGLDREDGLVDQSERHLGGDGLAVGIAGHHRQRTLVARLIGVAIGAHLQIEEIPDRRHHHLLAVGVEPPVADHVGLKVDVGDVPLPKGKLDELDRAGHVHEPVAVHVVALDGKEHVPVVCGNAQHHRRSLAGPEGVGVDDDLDPVGSVAQLGGGVVRDPDGRLGENRRASRGAGGRRLAPPPDAVVPLVVGGKDQGGLALVAGLDRPGQDLL